MMKKIKYHQLMICGLLASSLVVGACKNRILPQAHQLSEGEKSQVTGEEWSSVYQRCAQVIGLALAEYVRTGVLPSTDGFILPKIPERGVTEQQFQDFETRILDIYGYLNPEAAGRVIDTTLGLSWEEAGWVRTYYNFEEIRLTSDIGISYVQSAIAYAKYEKNRDFIDTLRSELLRMSVQQIADAHNVSVNQVRAWLWQYDISLAKMWRGIKEPGENSERNLFEAALFYKYEGVLSNDQIAQKLKVSVVALENLLHFIGYENFNRDWTDKEVLKLKILWKSIETKDLALILGRSEESIYAKARAENLTESYAKPPRRLVLPEFNDTDRLDFETQHELIEDFLKSTMDLSLDELGAVLDVTPETIRRWSKRLNLTVTKGYEKLSEEHDKKRQEKISPQARERFARQREYIEKEIALWKERKVNVIRENCPRLLGISMSTYVVNGGVFKDNLDRLFAFMPWLEQNPLEFRIVWEKTIHSPSDQSKKETQERWNLYLAYLYKLRSIYQRAVIELMAEEVAQSGELNGGIEGFAQRQDIVGVALRGTRVYSNQGASYNKRIFDSPPVLLVSLARAIDQKIKFETDLERKKNLENFSPPNLSRPNGVKKRESNEFQNLVAREKQKMFEWGERFTQVVGFIPGDKFLRKTPWTPRFVPGSNYWQSRSAYQEELKALMELKGFKFEYDKSARITYLTAYPEGFAIPIHCEKIKEVLELVAE